MHLQTALISVAEFIMYNFGLFVRTLACNLFRYQIMVSLPQFGGELVSGVTDHWNEVLESGCGCVRKEINYLYVYKSIAGL